MKHAIKLSAIIFICALMFTACGGGGGGGEEVISTTPIARIDLSTTSVAFGDVVWGEQSDQTITIQNTGASSSSLTIGQIAGTNSLALPFSIENDNCSGKSLTASQTCTFQVRFAPDTGDVSGLSDSFNIPTNDPDQPSGTVNVTGNGRGLRVYIDNVSYASCPNIELIMTVTDKDGVKKDGLLDTDFILTEDGDVKIKTLEAIITKLPVSVALALDYSGSMGPLSGQVITDMKTASKNFVDNLDGVNDEAAIINFSTDVIEAQAFTTDKDTLKLVIDNGYDPSLDRNQTHLYDATYKAIEVTFPRDPSHSHAVVVLTDGEDYGGVGLPGSVRTLTEVIDYAKTNGVPIFTIGLGNAQTMILNQMANETGGQYFYAPDSSKLNAIYQKIADILTGQYKVTYSQSNNGPIRTLNVLVDIGGLGSLQGVVTRQISGCP